MGQDENKNFNALEELNRISAGSSDIIINNNASKKKKGKALIITVVILLLIITIVVLVFVKNIQNSSVNKETVSKFTDFAKTYLGDDVDFSNPFSPATAYSVDDAIESNDYTFFENAKQKFSDFTNSINDATADDIKNTVEQYKKTFDFAYAYGTSVLPTEDDIVAKYKKAGKVATVDYIKSAYSKIIEVNYNDSDIDAKNEIAYYTAMVDLYDLYVVNGCMSQDGTGDGACLENKIGKQNVSVAVSAISNAKKKRVNLSKYVNYSKSALWDLNKKISGEKK